MQRPAKLVGARSKTASATYTLQLCYNLGNGHPRHQTGYALQIAVTSSPERNIFQHVVLYLEFDVGATGPLGLICIFHYSSPESSTGFILVYTFCTSSSSSRRSTILSIVARCSSVSSFSSFGMRVNSAPFTSKPLSSRNF